MLLVLSFLRLRGVRLTAVQLSMVDALQDGYLGDESAQRIRIIPTQRQAWLLAPRFAKPDLVT